MNNNNDDDDTNNNNSSFVLRPKITTTTTKTKYTRRKRDSRSTAIDVDDDHNNDTGGLCNNISRLRLCRLILLSLVVLQVLFMILLQFVYNHKIYDMLLINSSSLSNDDSILRQANNNNNNEKKQQAKKAIPKSIKHEKLQSFLTGGVTSATPPPQNDNYFSTDKKEQEKQTTTTTTTETKSLSSSSFCSKCIWQDTINCQDRKEFLVKKTEKSDAIVTEWLIKTFPQCDSSTSSAMLKNIQDQANEARKREQERQAARLEQIKQPIHDHLNNDISKVIIKEKVNWNLYNNSDSTTSETKFLWDESYKIPLWMKQYFRWHTEQVRLLRADPSRITQNKYMIMRCLKDDKPCGGTADRLKPILTVIWLSYWSNRILFIYWERPCNLENFLLPPSHGIDWRLPKFMIPTIQQISLNPSNTYRYLVGIKSVVFTDQQYITTIYQSHDFGWPEYNANRTQGELSYDKVYHDVWRTLFTPVLPIQQMIHESMTQLNIKPYQYASSHYRSLYLRNHTLPKRYAKIWSINGINCASELNPTAPAIYFATDSKVASSIVKEYIKSSDAHNKNIVTLPHFDENPLHLEKAHNWHLRDPSEYYETFRDFYLLGQSNCIAYSKGGFGQWALMLSYNTSCVKKYANPKFHTEKLVNCKWTHPSSTSSSSTSSQQNVVDDILPLITEPITITTDDNNNENGNDSGRDTSRRTLLMDNDVRDDYTLSSSSTTTTTTTSTTIPQWMKEYFIWHTEQIKQINETNWLSNPKKHNYLILFCGKPKTKVCGGLSDRLKPIPTLLWAAYKYKRILFIYWTYPYDIEEFLTIPPSPSKTTGGMRLDWRLPIYIKNELSSNNNKLLKQSPLVSSTDEFHYFRKTNYTIFLSKIQSPDSGERYFIQQTNTSYETFYHDMFRVLFQPSPPVAKILNNTLNELKESSSKQQQRGGGGGSGSVEYASSHLRAFFGREEDRNNPTGHKQRTDKELKFISINAVNCASQLKPGGPIYFASDSMYATNVVQEYAKETGRSIISIRHDIEPYHLDLKGFNETSAAQKYPKPSDFYSTFVDLFLMGESSCVAYSNGGFGTFGLLISYNTSCSMRHFRRRKKMNICNWLDEGMISNRTFKVDLQ